MTEISQSGSPLLAYLRRPHFLPDAERTPQQAVIHALLPFILFSLNVWMTAIGLVVFIGVYFSLPIAVTGTLAAIAAVPCVMASWSLFVRCVEVEAQMVD